MSISGWPARWPALRESISTYGRPAVCTPVSCWWTCTRFPVFHDYKSRCGEQGWHASLCQHARFPVEQCAPHLLGNKRQCGELVKWPGLSLAGLRFGPRNLSFLLTVLQWLLFWGMFSKPWFRSRRAGAERAGTQFTNYVLLISPKGKSLFLSPPVVGKYPVLPYPCQFLVLWWCVFFSLNFPNLKGVQ